MNLMTIKKRLENNYYWDIAECYDDIDLIVENCRRFSKYVMYCTIDRLNGHHMEGWKHVDCLARSLKNSFLEMITKMPANEIVLE